MELYLYVLYFSGKDAVDPVWKDSYPLYIYPDGSVLWKFRGNFRSFCDLDIFKFPFDTQVCYLKFGNIIDMDEVINGTNAEDYVHFGQFMKSQEFRYV